MTFKAKPKKTNPYPKLLNEAERRRNRDWVINKANLGAMFKKSTSADPRSSRSFLRRFSGKRG